MFRDILNKLKEKKLLVVGVLLFFAVNIIIYTTFSEKTTSTIWDGSIADKFSEGSGTSEDPYIIKDGSELAYFMQVINSDDNGDYFNKYYSLKNNIDLDGNEFSFAELNKSFSGTFNGNGYRIFNFKINKYYYDEKNKEANYVLFDSLNGANIRNLNLNDITFEIDKNLIKTEEIKDTVSNNNVLNLVRLENEIIESTKQDDSNDGSEPTVGDNEKTTDEINNTEKTDDNDKVVNPLNNDETKTDVSNDDENTSDVSNNNDEKNVDLNDDNTITKDDSLTDETVTTDNSLNDETLEVKDEINHINVGLFKNASETVFNNINIYDINIDTEIKDEYLTSSLFLINDVDLNVITNVNLNGSSSNKNTAGLINNYNNAKLTTIIYDIEDLNIINDYKEENEELIKYSISEKGIEFESETDVNKVLDSLNSSSNLEWKFEDNKFRIVNLGVNEENPKRIMAKGPLRVQSAIPVHASGIDGTNVYVNDLTSDYNYYLGQNYTVNSNGLIPTGIPSNTYNEDNLIEVHIHYSGTDINDSSLTGYVGRSTNNEHQSDFYYFKYFPLKNGKVTFDLIDNPYSERPTGKAFNGWVTDYEDATVSLNMDEYYRYVTIDNVSSGDVIDITFNAVWIDASVITDYRDVSDLDEGFVEYEPRIIRHYEDVSIYYLRGHVNRNTNYPTGMTIYDYYGDVITATRCTTRGGCNYYYRNTSSVYNENTTYYELYESYYYSYFTSVTPSYTTEIISPFPDGFNLAGNFYGVRVTNGNSVEGLYDSDGYIQTGTCSGTCNYYKLIQYNNINDCTYNSSRSYYYLVTRDTNFLIPGSNVTNTITVSRPLTITGLNGSTFNTRSIASNRLTINDNLRLDHITITGTNRINSNNNNVKFARRVLTSTVSTNGGASNSASSYARYRFIVESGTFDYIYGTLYSTSSSGSAFYSHNHTTVGSDYDRVKNDNAQLTVTNNVIVGRGTALYATSSSLTTDVSSEIVVKSGRIGYTETSELISSVYMGIFSGGKALSATSLIVEGGDINKIFGGVSRNADFNDKNYTYINVKGGEIGVIFGGASYGTTYGNRIINVTGGKIRNSVFGGSNGAYLSGTSKAVMESSTFIHIGGDAEIGSDSSTLTFSYGNTTYPNSAIESGSIFGAGNGQSGADDVGIVKNSVIVVDGEATIKGNVYGGGNYGRIGLNNTDSTAKIYVSGGEVKGSVYGGGNNNGSGVSGRDSTVTINMTDGDVDGSVYGGSRAKGYIYGSANVNIIGGTVNKDVYGGGEGGFSSSSSPGTFVQKNVNVTIGDNTSGPSISGSVYGGSAYGTVNATTTNANLSNYTTNVTVNKGNITGSVFGGAKGSSTYTPYVSGNITVDINGGTITSVYGGFDEAGKPKGSSTVYIDGGTVGNAYGGGNKTSIDTTDIYLRNGTVTTNVYGGSNQTGTVLTSNVHVSGGQATNVYGGNNAGGTCSQTNVTITGGTISSTVYGGGNEAEAGSTNVNISGGTMSTVYGGGNEADITGNSNIAISAGTISTVVYGGGNEGEVAGNTTVNITGTTAPIPNVYGGGNNADVAGGTTVNVSGGSISSAVYGGGNLGEVDHDTHVTISGNNTSVSTVYGGGNKAKIAGNTNVNITGGTITTVVYGGGNEGEVDHNANVTVNGSGVSIPIVYGGGNQAKVSGNTGVTITNGTISTAVLGGGNEGEISGSTLVAVNGSGASIPTVYGGGNKAAVVGNTTVNITNGTISSAVYGGGNEGTVGGSTNVNVSNSVNVIPSVFGGGNKAGANNTNVTFSYNGRATNVYGGSNQQGVVTESHVNINNGVITNVYGGNNAGGSTTTTHVNLTNGTVTTIYGGGNEAVSTDTFVTVDGGSVTNVYGGGNKAAVTNATSVEINGSSNAITSIFGGGNQAGASTTSVELNTGTQATNVFGGSNQLGVVGSSHITVNNATIGSLYGGNDKGGQTNASVIDFNNGSANVVYGGGNLVSNGTTTITIDDGTIGTLYGGGNQALCSSTSITINDGSFGDIYAGGNGQNASVTTNTELLMLGGEVTNFVYGGGNEGKVNGNTNVLLKDATIGKSAYAGGNGSNATVIGNTSITVSGDSTIGTSSCTLYSQCSVFGGGKAALTGSELSNNSHASVKIAGATIYGNVYGGPNTSKVYGNTDVEIGAGVQTSTNVVADDIYIRGTVFGGGEANASGSDTYDWTFVSVSNGIEVNINGAGYSNFQIDGSIFGSGNASTTTGTSEINIKNYGTFNNPKRNVSIQRTDMLTIDNSAIVLEGATDRENEYSDVLFTLSRIDELDLKNNSTLFLETGANLLKEFKSLEADGDLAKVEINHDTKELEKSVDNRIYMFIDKKLNIAKNQSVTDYGEVSGMTFFGMYKYNSNGTINTGIYGNYDYDDTLNWNGVFDNVSSYVLGLHKSGHDIEKDGFYTNYIDGVTSKNVPDYITPTPPTGQLYMWTIGEGVIEYEIDLVASKYSTLGTVELSLRDFTDPNTSFQILGFDYSELEEGIQLVERSQIKKIADTENEADTIMGVAVETSNTGWLVNGSTQFLSLPIEHNYIGTEEYIGGNNEGAPTLLFYLYHSKNISQTGNLGKVKIQLNSIRQIDALTKETKRVNVTINLSRVLYDTVNYEGAMTAGRKYDLFTSTATNITSSSAISSYYSLFNSGASIYRTGYHRSLISNYVLPLNTKITMIDLAKDTPEYYYHIIDASDVTAAENELRTNREVSYDLAMFEVMGALNSGVYYNDAQKNIDYCDSGTYCNEEYVFIIDFGDTNITADALSNKLLLEIRDNNNETIYSVLAPQHDNLIYNIYYNKDAIIRIDGDVSTNKIYNGESLTADLDIDYTQSLIGSTTVYDTHYFDSKLGLKISLINSNNEVVSGVSIIGLYYEIDGHRYYPNVDGTTRIKIADKVDSAEKWVFVNTGTSTLRSGNYKLRFETFGSPDGIYYGLESSDYVDFDIEIVNEIYGLDVTTTAEEMIIDSLSGKNANGASTITYDISYNSGLTNPSIRFKMYRRNTNSVDDTSYTLIDAQPYFDNTLLTTGNQYEYKIVSNPNEETTYTFRTNSDLVTGTYKMQFILYDDTSQIGSVEKYIIIK